MLFSSLPFLYYFLPVTLILYGLVPKKGKNFILLMTSLFFYGWGEPKTILLMILSITVGYFVGIKIEQNLGTKVAKRWLIVSVIFNLGMLGLFKYADFFISNLNLIPFVSLPLLKLALPIGISFYTFQIMSYTIDVYRADVSAQKNFISLAAYISLFPQLIAGPIVRYKDVDEQLTHRTHSSEKMALGIRRFVIGLAKKVLIANQLGELTELFLASKDQSVVYAWMYAIAFMLHIYFDFSGYSDMAIGLGKFFGFELLENFNYPYISKSITEFWRRWHISLGTWFKDYVYIPLGGNRVSKSRHFINILVVWFLTGFWHGASWNFIVWGLYFAVILMIEKNVLLNGLNRCKVINHVYVLILVSISFVIFNATDLSAAVVTLKTMFGLEGASLYSVETAYMISNYGFVLILAALGATPLPKTIFKKLNQNAMMQKFFDVAEPVLLGLCFLMITAYLVDGSFNPFLYFRF